MSSAPFQAFGLSCPLGGTYYVCQDSPVEFLGCCTSDPCKNGGKCPAANLRMASFSGDAYSDLPPQGCDDTGGSLWYTCKFNKPPFMGCCINNPCATGSCPTANLTAAKLSDDADNRARFLTPSATGATTSPTSSSSSTSTSATSTSSSSGTAVPNLSPSDQSSSGLSTGAIAGISVGVGLLFIILIALLMYKFGWSAGKRRERKNAPTLPPPMGQSQYDQSQYEPSEAAYYDNNGQPSPFRDSYQSSVTALGSPRSTMFAKQQQQDHMNKLSPDMYGVPYPGVVAAAGMDQRHPSPAYSQWSQHTHPPLGGGFLPVVHEIDSNSKPQELDADHGARLYRPYVPPPEGQPQAHQQLQQPQTGLGHSRGPSFDSALSSPRQFPESNIVSDNEGGSQFGSPLGSPRYPPQGGYTSVPLGDDLLGTGRQYDPPRNLGSDDELYPTPLQPSQR